MPAVDFSPFLTCLLAGVVVSQAFLIATWTSLSTQARLFRFTTGGLLASAMWLQLMIAFRLSDGNNPISSVGLAIALHVAAAIATACVALSIARWVGKWQIRPPSAGNDPQQFTLRYSLGLMGLLCILLALGRVVLTPTPAEATGAVLALLPFAFYMAIGTALVVLLCTIIAIAVLYVFIHSDQFDGVVVVIGVPVYSFVVTLAAWTIIKSISQSAGSETPIALLGFALGLFGAVACTMFWLRRTGFIMNRDQAGASCADEGGSRDLTSADLTTHGLPPLHPLSHL